MRKIFPAVIHEEEGFWVEFPDLDGCFSSGETLEETLDNATEALGLYLVSLMEDGIEIPEPTNIKDLKVKENPVVYISTDVNKYRRDTRAVKKMISIPSWLAKEVDKKGLSLSKILQEALLEKIEL